MAISNYGELKSELSRYLFHQRFVADYDDYTIMFETDANSRLRVLPMEASALLTTVNGEVTLPADYLVWRTVLPVDRTRYPTSSAELEYVHPAYLPVTGNNRRPHAVHNRGHQVQDARRSTTRLMPMNSTTTRKFPP